MILLALASLLAVGRGDPQGTYQDAYHDAFRVPTAAAARLNREGRDLYRQQHWDEARQRYRAAMEADPAFAAPQLNIACSLARQERFAEAAGVAAELVARAFVPWAREVAEATDLAALRARGEMAAVALAAAKAGAAWGAEVSRGLMYVARMRPALDIGESGTQLIAMNQEIVAWLPATGNYRQVTAEDGRILAFVRSADGRRVMYLRGGKMLRDPPHMDLFRDLSLRTLDVPSMVLGPPVALQGDVKRVTLAFATGGVAQVFIERVPAGVAAYVLTGGNLAAFGLGAQTRGQRAITFSTSGVVGDGPINFQGGEFRAANTKTPSGTPGVQIKARTGSPFFLTGPFGAGLAGLPLPLVPSAPEQDRPQRSQRRQDRQRTGVRR